MLAGWSDYLTCIHIHTSSSSPSFCIVLLSYASPLIFILLFRLPTHTHTFSLFVNWPLSLLSPPRPPPSSQTLPLIHIEIMTKINMTCGFHLKMRISQDSVLIGGLWLRVLLEIAFLIRVSCRWCGWFAWSVAGYRSFQTPVSFKLRIFNRRLRQTDDWSDDRLEKGPHSISLSIPPWSLNSSFD